MSDDVPRVADRDDIAGIVDLFGALTRTELSRALAELAFKRRVELDDDAVDAAIDGAVAEYALVPAPRDAVSAPLERSGDAAAPGDESFLAVGPAAFPSLPDGATDLPHILDVPEREVDRDRLADAALERLSADAVEAITDGDEGRLSVLADVTYDVEAWAAVDAGLIRERIVDEVDR